MRLEDLDVEPARLQRRRCEFAGQTVDAILSEGFRAEKFDPIPVFKQGGRWCVGGDGHSRLEALKRLRETGREVPKQIPVRVIDADAAERLADTANVSRTPFSAVEEAEIFRRRLDAGETAEQIGKDMHRSAFHVSSRSTLADLCETIKSTLGTEAGMSVEQGVAFAKACARHGLTHADQQQLWLNLLSKGDYTPMGIDLAVRVYATRMRGKGSDPGALFDLPRNVKQAVGELEKMCRNIQKVRAAILTLQRNLDLLAPEWRKVVDGYGDAERARLVEEFNEVSTALGAGRVMWHYDAATTIYAPKPAKEGVA